MTLIVKIDYANRNHCLQFVEIKTNVSHITFNTTRKETQTVTE